MIFYAFHQPDDQKIWEYAFIIILENGTRGTTKQTG